MSLINKMGDISKGTVAVLLVITILVSVIGTLTVLNSIDNVVSKQLSVTKEYGKVSVEITKPQVATGTGDVSVNIVSSPA